MPLHDASTWSTWTADTSASTSYATWTTWVTTASNTTSAADTWTTWVVPTQTATYTAPTTVTTTSSYYSTQVWIRWNEQMEWQQLETVPAAPVVVDQERVDRERRELEERSRKAAEERAEAVRKAKALLASLLTVQQQEQLERQRFFEFVSQTGRKFRMKHGMSRNIDEIGEDGKRLRTYCAHPGQYDLVPEDHMVAQLLTLQHDEAAFMRVANVS